MVPPPLLRSAHHQSNVGKWKMKGENVKDEGVLRAYMGIPLCCCSKAK